MYVQNLKSVAFPVPEIIAGTRSRLTPPLFRPNSGGVPVFPLHQMAHVGVSPSRGLKLFGREIIFEQFQPMWSRYLYVTHRRTDGRTNWDNIRSRYRALH